MRINRICKTYQGQSLLEVVLSIGVASLVITALIIMGASSVRTVNSSLRRSEATKLAVSGVEALRFYRDVNGFSATVNGCYKIDTIDDPPITYEEAGSCIDDGWVPVNVAADLDGDDAFDRQIIVEDYPAGASPVEMKKITSSVRWLESTGDSGDPHKEVSISTILSVW